MAVDSTDSSEDFSQRLFSLADEQAGYFTAKQALAVGYSYPNQSYHRKQGHWQDAGWGLYRLRDYPASHHEPWVRLSLWSRTRAGEPQAVVSHESALSLHELSDVMPAKTHLTVPQSFRKTPPKGVVLHKAVLGNEHIEQRQGFYITTVLRTLLDVAASSISPEHLEQASLEALERGLVRRSKFEEAVQKAPANVRERFAYIGLP